MSRNPARSRPLSANVRRLMRMARETPLNPDVGYDYHWYVGEE